MERCCGGAQAGAGAGDQLGAGERAVQVVVGAGVEHRVGHPALGGDGDRQQPRVAEARVVAQRPADLGRVQPGGVAVDDDQVDRFGLQRVTRREARRTARGACPAALNQDWISGSAAPTTSTPAMRVRTVRLLPLPRIIAR